MERLKDKLYFNCGHMEEYAFHEFLCEMIIGAAYVVDRIEEFYD